MPPHPGRVRHSGRDAFARLCLFVPYTLGCVDEGRVRVAILSVSPEIADLTAAAVKRLGHDPVAAVAPRRDRAVPGLVALDAVGELQETDVVVAPDRRSLEPILQSLSPDVVLCWAFPWRIPPEALQVPRHGAINCHPSLLPRHRGPNPLAWTIRMGDEDFGLTWHRMEAEFDSGPVLAQRSTPVLLEDTFREVIPRLNGIGLRMLRGVMKRVFEGEPGEPQPDEGMTEAPAFGADYAVIDWSRPARAVHDQVRAWRFAIGSGPVDGPFGEIAGRRVKVLRTTLSKPSSENTPVECGDGPLWVLETEPAE
jgi:methionyl-tRNA formyltransferase